MYTPSHIIPKTLQSTLSGSQFQNLPLPAGAIKEQSFSFEVEAQREYVHRLKMQREKIQALYEKYDVLLQEMKRKDDKISEQERKINQLSLRCKQYLGLIPQMENLRKYNTQLLQQSQSTKQSLASIQQSYTNFMNGYKTKQQSHHNQQQKLQQYNDQLLSKLHLLQQKFQDKSANNERATKEYIDKIQQLTKQMHQIKNQHVLELSILNGEILNKDQDIDILTKDIQKLRESIVYLENVNRNSEISWQEKISRVHSEYKSKIKSIKKQIDEHVYNNQILKSKISSLTAQLQKQTQQTASVRNSLHEQLQKTEQAIYELKLIANQDKAILRQNIIQLQTKLGKAEKQLTESMRREKELLGNVRRIQESNCIRRDIRQVERRELERIDRLLLLEK